MEPIKLIPLHSGRAEVWSNGAENLSVHLTYDISNYLKSWPDAQPSVAFERADGEKYPHAWELDGPVLHIPLLLADTETPGMCKCMITMLSGDGRANTMVFYGSVTEGIDSLGEAPTDPMLGIIEQVNLAAADANAAKVGVAGADGVSPIISIEDIAGGHRLTITDKDGTKTVDVMNGAQPDWNENDETSPAYVKGRTHWKEISESDIYSEMTLAGEDGQFFITTPPLAELVVGTMVTVTYNGTDYECKVVDAEPLVGVADMAFVFGNIGEMGLEGDNADAPFVFMLLPVGEDGLYGQVVGKDETATSVTFSIKGVSEVVHPLPKEYLGELRGQQQITITIAEDGTVTSDTEFAAAWAMDPGELQTGILIHESSKYKGDTYATPADVCKNEGPFGTSIILRVNNPAKDTSDSTDSDDVRIIRWQSLGVIGISSWIQKGLPYMSSGADWTGHYLRYNGIAWFPRETTEMKTDLGLSALNTANAGKLLYIDADGNAQPLSLGDGLAIVDGVLTLTGALNATAL